MYYPQSDINGIQSTDYGEILSSITDITTLLCLLLSWLDELKVYVTGPAKIDYLSTKNHRFLACLLYHNLITIYTTATKNLMSFLLQLMEME